ncbi:15149_t:CDS:2 [Funneliformis caledonium]|uniref:15149_t:CDS:1 n=1 Tax=Funneliformis caledonium TaxID=1117310 RepID=A0A9N9FGZ1_9GLOM|nr:15149_t:CDS:2 [Funneliformis caledonium]
MKTLTSGSSPQPDEIHLQIKGQEEENQDDPLTFLPQNCIRRYTNKKIPAPVIHKNNAD